MFTSRRLAPIFLASFTTLLFFLLFQTTHISESLQHVPEAMGLGDQGPSEEQIASGKNIHPDLRKTGPKPLANPNALYKPGIPKTPGASYSRTLVIARTKEENTTWIESTLGDMLYPQGPLQTAIYVVNDKDAPLHPPKNKGHEVMVYLTYIIDHYDNLPDISMFMHSHRWAWHNNDILDNDSAQIIRYLSPERVIRSGYMNLRCHWDPGCPSWLHPGAVDRNMEKQEETLIAESWSEIFPLDPIPGVLSQPCCAQFALSKERILAIPLARFVYYRDWLLRTPLDDYLSGRIWEYVWQFVFTGNSVECPAMNECYCDGYGLCFGGPEKFNEWFEMRYHMREYEQELVAWRRKVIEIEEAKKGGRVDEVAVLEVPELGRDDYLNRQILDMRAQLGQVRFAAWERGKSPQARAFEAGRPWKDGDGF